MQTGFLRILLAAIGFFAIAASASAFPPLNFVRAMPDADGRHIDLQFDKNLSFAGKFAVEANDGTVTTQTAALVFDFSTNINFARVPLVGLNLPSSLDLPSRIKLDTTPIGTGGEIIEFLEFAFIPGTTRISDVRQLLLNDEFGTLGFYEGIPIAFRGRIVEGTLSGDGFTVEVLELVDVGDRGAARGDEEFFVPVGLRVLVPANRTAGFRVGDFVRAAGTLSTDLNSGMLTLSAGQLGLQLDPSALDPRAPFIPTIKRSDSLGGSGDPFQAESNESTFIRVNQVSYTITRRGDLLFEAGAVLDFQDEFGTFQVYVDPVSDLPGTPIPSGTFDILGIYQQFDTTAPFFGTYRLVPRGRFDIITQDAGNAWILTQ